MAGEWRPVTLADVCREVRYGYTASATDRPTGIRFLRVTDIASGMLDWKNVPFCEISDQDFERYRLEPGDIVIARMGTIGVSALIRERSKAVAASYLIRHRLHESIALPQFIAYVFRSPAYWDFIWSHGGCGAVQPNINAKVLGQFCFQLPPLPEQRAIAHILGTLDDKIELNRRMSETLEAMARALFKAWFVDFEPVRAKMEGRWRRGQSLPGLPADLYDLFPDRLVDSELGEIPEGWAVTTLADHFDAVKGVSYKGSGLCDDGVALHNLNSIYEGGGYKYEGIKYYYGEYAERHVVRPGDVIVANTEQGHDRLLIGYAAIVPRVFGDHGIASHHIYRLRPKPESPLTGTFLCWLLNSPQMHDVVSGYANGTTVNMLPIDGVQKPPVVCPPARLVAAFDSLVLNAEGRREEMISESRTLAALRDALLPKLISGELRLKDAEGFLASTPPTITEERA